jgi:hypothetical protein
MAEKPEKPEYEKAWERHVASLLKAELKRRQISYAELAARLNANGAKTNEENIANKLSRGAFTAVFLFQCLQAIGATSIDVPIAADIQAAIDRMPCQ